MGIRRYTNPLNAIRINGINLTEASKIIVTYQKDDVKISKTDSDLAVEYVPATDAGYTTISVNLTQAETGSLQMDKYAKSTVRVQVNWILNGRRNATRIKCVCLGDNLESEVINA